MKTIFVVGMSAVNQKIVQLIFSNCFDGLQTIVRIKTCKEENQHHFLLKINVSHKQKSSFE